jgi:hypothetical protein
MDSAIVGSFRRIQPAPIIAAFSLIMALGAGQQSLVQARETATKRTPLLGSEQGPLVLELFTSEGCSSCPEADNLLSELGLQYPDSIFCLSEHVDYWNHLGWKDPYSLKVCTERQLAYARKLKLSTVYTPQLVVNGSSEGVGNNISSVSKAISANSHPRPFLLKFTCRESTTKDKLEIEILPFQATKGSLVASLVITDDEIKSRVTSGENAGRTLDHRDVVRQFLTLALPNQNADKPIKLSIPISKPKLQENSKLTIILQEPEMGRIVAVGRSHLNLAKETKLGSTK